jgi:hypothetical protein
MQMDYMEKMALNSLLHYELELLCFNPDFDDYYIGMNGDILEPNEQKASLIGAIEALEILLYDYNRLGREFDEFEWEDITLELNKRKLRYLVNEFTLLDSEFEKLVPTLNRRIANLIIKAKNKKQNQLAKESRDN